MKEDVKNYLSELKDKSPQEIISYFIHHFPNKILFASSMGMEDQVVTDMVCKIDPAMKIITLDTGRLFPETYDLISKTCVKYKTKIQVYFPDNTEVENMVSDHGINLFYKSVKNRKLCCNIRKVNPFKRALEGYDVWISGLRRTQSVTRQDINIIEWDEANSMIKINPIIEWSYDDVKNYINENKVPYNPLHDKDFPSIGCQPCTRAILPDEDLRAGRWWWENPENKECGLNKN